MGKQCSEVKSRAFKSGERKKNLGGCNNPLVRFKLLEHLQENIQMRIKIKHVRGLAFSSGGGESQIYWGRHKLLERKIGGVIKFLMTKM